MSLLTDRRSDVDFNRTGDVRNPYERDRARIIHSAAFRRLQAKTQILGIGDGDFHRTRLTHSMEVSQICRGLIHFFNENPAFSDDMQSTLPPVELIEAIGLSHDIGHPPFGHGGECVLNYFMRNDGGFEANGQTLRLLSKLEAHTDHCGLDLTRRLLLGILKYPVKYSNVSRLDYPQVPENMDLFNPSDFTPPKCYHDCDEDVVNWIFKPFSLADIDLFTSHEGQTMLNHSSSLYKAFDTSIMDVADDIAYGTHDLEDGIALNLITRDDWEQEVSGSLDSTFASHFGLQHVVDSLFGKGVDKSDRRKRSMGAMVHSFINSAQILKGKRFESDLLDYQVRLSPEADQFLQSLQAITTKHMIDLHTVKTFEYRGQRILLALINAFSASPLTLMTPSYAEMYESAKSVAAKKRIICDYIAGMTDDYAIRMYERLFVPRHGNVFDKL